MDRAALAAVKTIVAHDGCADGTASAILLHDALPDAEVIFADYGSSAAKLVAAPGMLFCDFSPPPARVEEFLAARSIVLDHHRTAKPIVARFGDRGVFGDEVEDPGVSGAVLAYRHVWLPLRGTSPEHDFAEWFATAAGARDTWQTSSLVWHDGCVQHAVLHALRQAHWLDTGLTALAASWKVRYQWLGEELLAKERDRLERAIASAHRFTTPSGVRAIAIHGLGFASDAAERLTGEVDVVIAYDLGDEAGTPVIRASLRSHTSFDCADFAERFGGGGHTRAAGFAMRLDEPHPLQLLERVFADASL